MVSSGNSVAGGAGGGSTSLMEAWLEKLRGDGKLSGSAEDIREKMKEDLVTTWNDLKSWLAGQGSNEIAELCANAGGSATGPPTSEGEYLKNLCKGIAEVKYFVSGVRTKRDGGGRSDQAAEIEQLTRAQSYARCIVGSVALNELYGDHCKLDSVIEYVSPQVQGKLEGTYSKSDAELKKCEGINANHLMLGKSILASAIKKWAEGDREKEEKKVGGSKGTMRVGYVWGRWPYVCGGTARQKQEQYLQGLRKNNAKHMTKFLKVGNDNMSSGAATDGKPTIGEILTEEGYIIPQDRIIKALQDSMQSDSTASTPSFDLTKAIMENVTKVAEETEAEVCMKDNSEKFCKRLQCAKDYWQLTKDQSSSGDFWEGHVKKKLKNLITDTVDNGGAPTGHCDNGNSMNSANKEACKHMTNLLHQMYQNANGGTKEYSEQIIKCVLLREYAKKLKDKAQKEGYCDIDDGLQKAFNESKTIMDRTSQCGNANAAHCFECKWNITTDDELSGCKIDSNNDNVKTKVDQLLRVNDQTNETQVQKNLSDFNKENSLCERVKCAAKWWAQDTRNTGKEQNQFWENDVKKLWDELADKMKSTNGQGEPQCEALPNGTPSEKAACNYLHAGFTELYNPAKPAPTAAPAAPSPLGDILSAKHPSFRQTMGCLLLHYYAKHMKEKAVCNIDKGIKQAFDSWQNPSTKAPNCNGPAGSGGKGPCVPCQWDKNNELDSCLYKIKINSTTGSGGTAKEKVKKIIEDDKTNIPTMLGEINRMNKLCDYMECIASHLNSSSAQQNTNAVMEKTVHIYVYVYVYTHMRLHMYVCLYAYVYRYVYIHRYVCVHVCIGIHMYIYMYVYMHMHIYTYIFIYSTLQSTFWDKGTGEVGKLWKELAGAIMERSGSTQCDKVDGTRQATEPERKACEHLTAVFNKLRELTMNETSYPVLSKHPSFAQAMGCILLKEYAKLMKENSTCLIDSGLRKAFNTVGNGSNGNCNWEEKLDDCKVTIGSTTTEVQEKVKPIIKVDEKDIGIVTESINERTTLCDQLKCAVPNWFQKHSNGNAGTGTPTPTKNWCDFWDGAVKDALTDLFKKIESDGKTNTNSVCNDFGDGNEHSVERKACNHITAGLQHINTLSGNGNDQLLARAVGCIALNMYADKIITESKDKCPIDEIKITKMFNDWNEKNNNNSCKGVDRASNEHCFLCSRKENFNECKLSVDSSLVNTPSTTQSGASETCKTNETEVKAQIGGLLNEDNKIPQVKETLSTINEMDTFCTQLQCAAKKYYVKQNPGENSSKVKWEEVWNKVKEEVTSLGSAMYDNQNSTLDTHCSTADYNNKEVCLLFGAGLNHLYNNTNSNGDDAMKLFKRTMACAALNVYADQLIEKSQEKGCPIGEEEINKMFTKGNEHFKSSSSTSCPSDGSSVGRSNDCFTCERKANFSCQINSDDVKTKKQWLRDRGKSETEQSEENEMWNGVKEQVTQLDNNIGTNNDGSTDDLCKGITCPDGATDCVSKATCKLIVKALKGIHEMKGDESDKDPLKENNRIFRSTMRCVALNAFAEKLRQYAEKGGYACAVEEGIKGAFDAGKLKDNRENWCKKNGKEDGSCEPCEKQECFGSKIGDQELLKEVLGMLDSATNTNIQSTLEQINHMSTLCDYIRCAATKWFKNRMTTTGETSNPTKNWCQFWEEGVKPTLGKMFTEIQKKGRINTHNAACKDFGDGNEHSVERKACNHITAGLDYIKSIPNGSGSGSTTTQNGHQDDDNFFKQSMMCAALNLYADKIKEQTESNCPIDEEKITQMFDDWNNENNKNSSSSTSSSCSSGVYGCFKCDRVKNSEFSSCQLSVDSSLVKATQNGQNCEENKENVPKKMDELLNQESKMEPTLNKINEMASSFCTQVQCAIKKKLKIKNGQPGVTTTPKWSEIQSEIDEELKKLLGHISQTDKQKEVEQYCKDNDAEWYKLGHKESKTNKAACLLFASGLKHIYGRPNGQKNGQFKGPSFEQTMGCLFLKEYAKQLKDLAEVKKQGNSWVHPLCDIEDGINHAFTKSGDIMKNVLPECSNGTDGISCFVCEWNDKDYDKCNIGTDNVKTNVKPLLQSKETHMQQILENTVCPILLTDLLTPFLPLAPVSIGLSAMAYYLWKYFGPLGKGGPRLRRSPADIPGPSVQEQVLHHVEEAGPHEYQLVKERKPRSAPTRTKRSGPVNRRTIIEIHFEVLDECQKGDSQLNQKDFMELLVQEFMGSEFMEEEEQVPKEGVPMEGVPMESIPLEQVPMERVPSLGSVFMV
ncbi:SICAvar, type I [Plasmodium knowlesi strain H]|uniref:SICAvar, type I n=1 Tax=Plasmodium knowlesi (strain H) TaxID=5851 RepID=A0A1A7VWU6_PLAKH|nr:SICAvar, type I [Plasmodium knowlesi strain H]